MTMMYRSSQGQAMAKNLKQSDQSYQAGDSIVETMFQDFRRIDEGTYNPGDASLNSAKKIPQNILASTFCAAHNVATSVVICWKLDPSTGNLVQILTTDTTTKASDIREISAFQTGGSAARALQASITSRISTPLTALSAAKVGGNIRVSWTPQIDPTTDANGQTIEDTIEVRRARLTTAAQKGKTGAARGDLLIDTNLDWECVNNVGNCSVNLNQTQVMDTNASGGNTYAYTLKVTNKRSLNLDSPYTIPVIIAN